MIHLKDKTLDFIPVLAHSEGWIGLPYGFYVKKRGMTTEWAWQSTVPFWF